MSQKDFRLTTDYPPDVVKLITGSQAIPAGGVGSFRIDTGSATWAYPLMAYSFSADFSQQFFVGYGNYYPIDTGYSEFRPANDSLVVAVQAAKVDYSTGTTYHNAQVFAQYLSGTTAPARTLYWRMALIPLDKWENFAGNSQINTKFVFTTDNNYLKYHSHHVEMGTDPYTISTGLGYAPFILPMGVLAFDNVNIDSIDPLYTGTVNMTFDSDINIVRVKNNGDIQFSQMGAQSITQSAVRIYLDES